MGSVKVMCLDVEPDCLGLLPSSATSPVTLGKLCNLSEPQYFIYEITNRTYPTGLLQGFNELKFVELLSVSRHRSR